MKGGYSCEREIRFAGEKKTFKWMIIYCQTVVKINRLCKYNH